MKQTNGVEQMRRLWQAIKTLRPDAMHGKKQLRNVDVADLLDVAEQTITNWRERGISKEGLIKIQEVIGCSAIWVRDGVGPMVPGRGTPHETQTEAHARDSALETLIRYMPPIARTMMLAYGRCLLEMMEESPELFADQKQISEWTRWSKRHGHKVK